MDPVLNNITCWVSKTGRRPLLIAVWWGENAHWVCYENRQITHSASFGENKTRIGFPVRTDAVKNWETFEAVALDPSLDVSGQTHQLILEDIVRILKSIPEMRRSSFLKHLEQSINISQVHRTRKPDDHRISLLLHTKEELFYFPPRASYFFQNYAECGLEKSFRRF